MFLWKSYRPTYRLYIPRPQRLRFATMATLDAIDQEIAKQSAEYNQLRTQNDDPTAVELAKTRLGELKRSRGAMLQAAGGSKDKKKDRLLLKTPKGTRDYGPGEMFCREHIEKIVKECFALYGGSCLDTPVFERKDILAGKYGEDAKLIFDLMDQGGEQLALRYDHTVPLARYLAMAGTTINQAKLWQVGKVYRRDNPVMSKGRMREFSQADIDFAGVWDPMIPDAEIISLLSAILTKLELGEFTIKLNHRKILDGIFEVCGVPSDKIRTISSAVDKLDKLPWADVKKEMTEEKGLDPSVAERIGEYVKLQGFGSKDAPELLEKLLQDATLVSNANAKQGLSDMNILFTLLHSYKVLDKISFDMSLARGLDYYTGIIYEAIVEASAPPGFKSANAFASTSASSPAPTSTTAAPPPAPASSPETKKKTPKKKANDDDEDEVDESQIGVGSIAAGGRYDNLVGMFLSAAAGEGKKSSSIPCVGVSMGLDRIFAILWPRWVARGMRSKGTMAYVAAAGDGLLQERVQLAQILRGAGIQTEFLFKNKPKLQAQFTAGEKDEVPFVVILGPDELRAGLVNVKEQKWEFVDGEKVKVQNDDKGVPVKKDELVDWLKSTRTYQDWQQGIWTA